MDLMTHFVHRYIPVGKTTVTAAMEPVNTRTAFVGAHDCGSVKARQ